MTGDECSEEMKSHNSDQKSEAPANEPPKQQDKRGNANREAYSKHLKTMRAAKEKKEKFADHAAMSREELADAMEAFLAKGGTVTRT